jgi:acetoacetate decarboxylase
MLKKNHFKFFLFVMYNVFIHLYIWQLSKVGKINKVEKSTKFFMKMNYIQLSRDSNTLVERMHFGMVRLYKAVLLYKKEIGNKVKFYH